ncbi:hypothetical protein ACR1PO_19970 [Chryseobacterium sp. RRHN12]|uniref:hypothetical protein n=1 Tax=Chryseobacterium sp. RRHN12 TaxID=3437884 RepID=UPI002FCB6748
MPFVPLVATTKIFLTSITAGEKFYIMICRDLYNSLKPILQKTYFFRKQVLKEGVKHSD